MKYTVVDSICEVEKYLSAWLGEFVLTFLFAKDDANRLW